MEANQTKEDMKSLLNDLANADKEISVRQIHQLLLLLSISGKFVVGIPACLSFHRVWRRKWSFFSEPWAPRHGQMKLSVGSSLKGVSSSHWTEISTRFDMTFMKRMWFTDEVSPPSVSPAPVDLKQPRLHHPTDSEDIDLNMTYDITTPDDVAKRPKQVPSKKMRLDPPA